MESAASTGIIARARPGDLWALTKPGVNLMALCTTAGGYWLAPGERDLAVLFAVLLGTALAVGGASVLNMYLERDLDAHMTRTKKRPLPTGRIAPETALVFGLLLSVAGIPVLALLVNALTALVVSLALASYVLIYTPLKQKSSIALLVGAIPGAAPPLAGWTAATGRIDLPAVVLFAVLFFWQIPHFLAIALFRKEEYARAGLKLLPLDTNEKTTKFQIILWLVGLLAVSLLLYPLEVAGVLYSVIAAILGGIFLVLGFLGFKKDAGIPWARRLFFYSLIYLLALFAALAVDRSLA
ncbi:MAG: heme o synthase [Bdellovibrionota bacterium]